MQVNELVANFLAVDTTAICDADKATRVLDNGIQARSANTRIFGPAYTVRCRGDFFAVLRAIETASQALSPSSTEAARRSHTPES